MFVYILKNRYDVLAVYHKLEDAERALEDWAQKYHADYFIEMMEVE